MIGQTLGHYRIESKLGQGGMGVVYAARDLHLGRRVAIKVLPPAAVADPDRRRRFVQEAQAASTLNHPNILHIYDVEATGAEDGSPADFIAMEYVSGRTLDRLIAGRGLPVDQALQYAAQIAGGLAAAHAVGIVHRDLKPGNVMVNEQGLVKILDFGLAKLLEPLEADEIASTQAIQPGTQAGAILGTVPYMSPEQAEGKSVDARSDIFSFGAVLYEMITGRRAFPGDSTATTLAAILHQEPKPVSELVKSVPRELERIVGSVLEEGSSPAIPAPGRCQGPARSAPGRHRPRQGRSGRRIRPARAPGDWAAGARCRGRGASCGGGIRLVEDAAGAAAPRAGAHALDLR